MGERLRLSELIMVTGGARSGKSLFAEQYAAATCRQVAYIATAQAYDDEMRKRINLHKQRRPIEWLVFEAPDKAHSVITQAAKMADVVLFDCVTLYITNLMLSPTAPTDIHDRQVYVMNSIRELLNAAINSGKIIIFVTNEVGMGIVPENSLAREFRDLAGSVNQYIAAKADSVFMVVSGIPVEIKRIAYSLEDNR